MAAEGVGLDVRAGRALAVTGVNGAGKSTLALTLAGLLVPVRGTVRPPRRSRTARRSPSLWSRRGADLAPWARVFQHPEHQFLRPTVRAQLVRTASAAAPRRSLEGRAADAGRAARLGTCCVACASRTSRTPTPHALRWSSAGCGGRRARGGTARADPGQPAAFSQERASLEGAGGPAGGGDGRGTAVVAVTHDRDLVAALEARREARLVAPPWRRPCSVPAPVSAPTRWSSCWGPC
ncbi:ATP-binding cassette domain-containing protein [Kocuria rhizophila]|nr:ATP-binding cassette domain-containing protein [Kocuria rhizophila]